MLFSEQGFSPDLSNNEFKINDLIDEIRRGVVKNGKKTTNRRNKKPSNPKNSCCERKSNRHIKKRTTKSS